MNPKISIIVPVYKVVQYLPRCVKSLMAQTYQNFELILVDDGSPDRCPEMCDEYEKTYEQVRTLHKKNGGLSDARNAGMKIARGKYITFVDSDDYVNPLYLEMLVKGIQEGADISVCGFISVYDNRAIQKLDKTKMPVDIIDSKQGLTQVLYQGFHDVSAWGILLPFELAKKYPFPKGKLFEDLYTTYNFYLDTNKVAFIRVPLYYYFQRKDSIMSRRNDAFIHDLLEASNQLVQACKGQGTMVEKAALNKRFSNYCRLILQPSDLKSKYPESYHRIIETLKQERFSVLMDSRARKKNRLAALALMGGVAGLKWAFTLRSGD